jgi:hypothetical protein
MLHLEVWNSSENRQERHYFRKDGKSHAYQNAQYVFGYNPEVVSEETAAKIIALIENQHA